MKAYTDKLDFYRGRYKDQRLKNVCSLEGESESFLNLLSLSMGYKSRYCSAILILLLIPAKEMLPYLCLILTLSTEEDLTDLYQLCYRVRELPMGVVNQRIISNLPSSLDYLYELTSRDIPQFISDPSIQICISSYLGQFMSKEDASLLGEIAFYDDRSLLMRTICKRRGWSTPSLNNLAINYKR